MSFSTFINCLNIFQIQDTSASPTLSRLLTAGLNKGGSLKSDKSSEGGQAGADSLCAEMNDLMHDYEVMSRINDLASQLKGTYEVIKYSHYHRFFLPRRKHVHA